MSLTIERLQLAEQRPALECRAWSTSSPKTISVLILPACDAVGDLRQVDAHLGEANAGEPRAVGVRILVRADQQFVALADRAGWNR